MKLIFSACLHTRYFCLIVVTFQVGFHLLLNKKHFEKIHVLLFFNFALPLPISLTSILLKTALRGVSCRILSDLLKNWVQKTTIYLKSQSKKYCKRVNKRKYCLQINCLLHQKSTHFSLKYTKPSYSKWLKIQLKWFNTWPFFWRNESTVLFSFSLHTLPRTTKLLGRPIQKFDVKMMRLIYTFCFKNWTRKNFMKFFLQMTGNFSISSN